MSEYLLLTPGPTNVPRRVLEKTALPMIHHRTKEFQGILERVNVNLQKVFVTQHPVVTFASSGTGAMEASISNLLAKGDTVISFSAGKWGERYRDIARNFGLDVKSHEIEYGRAVAPEDVRAALKQYPNAKAVLVTHCETSTAVVHPIEEIAKITRASDTLLMVDAISGLLCDPLKMDEWGIDVVVGGSQKGFMLPPGLAFLAVNEKAQKAMTRSDLPKYYFDLAGSIKALKKNDTPYTPAVNLIRGLEEALTMLLEETLPKVWVRHAEVASFVRKSLQEMGLPLFSQAPSNALTAMTLPKDRVSKDLIKIMRDDHHVVMADGQGELQGRIIRFAHMGAACTLPDAKKGLEAFRDAWKRVPQNAAKVG